MSENHFTRDASDTNLMVLDGKEHEAMRILLQQWLVCFFWLNRRCNDCGVFLLVVEGCDDGLLKLDVVDNGRWDLSWHVFFAYGLEAKLFGWRIAHLELFNAGGRLNEW